MSHKAYKQQDTSPFQEVNIVKLIRKARFSVYLAKLPGHDDPYILKMFPYTEDNTICPDYINESTFQFLKHENIVNILYCQDKKHAVKKGKHFLSSCIIEEYCPFGDFFDLITNKKVPFDGKLARTFFRQLIDGLEYLHKSGVSHLDIKPDNLLLGKDFKLKICDFDLSYMIGDDSISSHGTKYFRAPELFFDNCENPQKADIFSAGIFLFVMKSGGILPQTEDVPFGGYNLFELMERNPKAFWEAHCKIEHKNPDFFDADFRELFMKLVAFKPEDRPSIEEIRNCKWFQGPIMSRQELKQYLKPYLTGDHKQEQ